MKKKYINLFESFNSIIEIKIRNVEQKFFDIFKFNNSKHILADRNVDLFNIFPRFILEFFGVFLFSCIILTLYSLEYSNSVILPIMALYAAAAFRVLPSVNRILIYYNSFLYGQKAFEKINIEFSNNYSEFSKNFFKPKNIQSDKFNFNKLEFKNVSFAYDQNKEILKDLNFEIKKGSFTGIKGKSGSGKSTLVLLMTGLLTPNSGNILINDHHNLNSSQINISSFTGYVSQKTTLFDDTIKKNIAIGISDNDVDEKHLNHVIEITQLKEFINNLKDGIDTIIGDDGLRISGGQRQRISIARALYFNPDLLIMDEATSALDLDIENKIIDILKNLRGKITLIFISHKISNLDICERKFEVSDNTIKKL
jgi:ATP-binding cassette subfamily C protein